MPTDADAPIRSMAEFRRRYYPREYAEGEREREIGRIMREELNVLPCCANTPKGRLARAEAEGILAGRKSLARIKAHLADTRGEMQ